MSEMKEIRDAIGDQAVAIGKLETSMGNLEDGQSRIFDKLDQLPCTRHETEIATFDERLKHVAAEAATQATQAVVGKGRNKRVAAAGGAGAGVAAGFLALKAAIEWLMKGG